MIPAAPALPPVNQPVEAAAPAAVPAAAPQSLAARITNTAITILSNIVLLPLKALFFLATWIVDPITLASESSSLGEGLNLWQRVLLATWYVRMDSEERAHLGYDMRSIASHFPFSSPEIKMLFLRAMTHHLTTQRGTPEFERVWGLLLPWMVEVCQCNGLQDLALRTVIERFREAGADLNFPVTITTVIDFYHYREAEGVFTRPARIILGNDTLSGPLFPVIAQYYSRLRNPSASLSELINHLLAGREALSIDINAAATSPRRESALVSMIRSRNIDFVERFLQANGSTQGVTPAVVAESFSLSPCFRLESLQRYIRLFTSRFLSDPAHSPLLAVIRANEFECARFLLELEEEGLGYNPFEEGDPRYVFDEVFRAEAVMAPIIVEHVLSAYLRRPDADINKRIAGDTLLDLAEDFELNSLDRSVRVLIERGARRDGPAF